MATWTNQSKSSAPTFTNQSKNSASWTSQDKYGRGDFLLQEDGAFIFQENSSYILLEQTGGHLTWSLQTKN